MLAILSLSDLNRSMRGTAEEQGSFTAIDVLCEELLDDEGFLVTLREARGTVFSDEDFDVLYPSDRGRPSHPPSVLAALLLAQLFYGVSDREAERRSRVDLSWKDALGLPLEHRGIPHVCLVEFRARVVRAEMAGFFNDKLLQLAKRAGVIGHRRRRRLDRDRRLRRHDGHRQPHPLRDTPLPRCCSESSTSASERRRVPLSSARTTTSAGKPEINWSSATERQELVTELCRDAAVVIEACGTIDEPVLDEAAELLRVVAAQDVEDDDKGGVAIRQGVARDRVISTVDVDARHGHRSGRIATTGSKPISSLMSTRTSSPRPAPPRPRPLTRRYSPS